MDAPQGGGAFRSLRGAHELVIPVLDSESIRRIVASALDEALSRLEQRLLATRAQEARVSAQRESCQLLSERDFASLLRCSARTIRRLELSGSVPHALRLGGSKRWRLAEVQAWMATLQTQADGTGTIRELL